MVSLRPVFEKLGAHWDKNLSDETFQVSSITYDSRQVSPGTAFFCIPGEHVDGNAFIADAIKYGATCVVTELAHKDPSIPQVVVKDVRLALAMAAAEFYGNPSKSMRLMGVTGTNGKTTITHLVERMMIDCGHKTGLIGTLGSRWADSQEYAEAKHTTPQPTELQRMLATMKEHGCTHVAMEVSSHALAQKRVAGCEFAVVCLTNITQDHLDFHKTMDNYWKSKRILFEELGLSSQVAKSAIVNYDDPLADEFLKVLHHSVYRITYGWSEKADFHVVEADFKRGGTFLRLATPEEPLELHLNLTGRFNVYNTMAAMAMCWSEGIKLAKLKESLEKFPGVAGRFEVISTGSGKDPLCIVDYAHTPDGLDNVLKAAQNIVPKGGRLIAVFGCGGDRDASKRPQMGEIAEARANEVVVTSDNPRTEDPGQIISNILTGIKRMGHVKVEPDRARAIRMAVLEARVEDVVVIAGKGHENYQILAEKVIPFDDRQETLAALNERLALLPPSNDAV